MMKAIIVILGLLWASPALAQNPQCPTRPAGDSTNACASTAFVQQNSLAISCSIAGSFPIWNGTAWQCSVVAGSFAFVGGTTFVAQPSGIPVTNTTLNVFPGTSAVADPVVAIQKISTYSAAATLNSALYVSMVKATSVVGSYATGFVSEMVDSSGGVDTFSEGGRAGSIITAALGGSAYGFISTAYVNGGSNWTNFLIGHESEVYQIFADAPQTFSVAKYSASFLATNSVINGAKKADAGFLENPFSFAPFRRGFLVGQNGADYAAFSSYAATTIGLELHTGTQTYAITLPNNTPIAFMNAANDAFITPIRLDTSDNLQLGLGAASTVIAGSVFVDALSVSGNFSQTGSISGTVTQAVQANAGTALVTWGTSTGTPAVTASSPLAITTATGNMTCTTCVTSAAALTTNALVIGAGLQATAVTITGTGVLTALGNTAGAAGGFALFNSLSSYLPLAGGTMTGGIGFSVTNTLDIGTNATTLAPRTVYAGTSFVGPIGTFTTSVAVGGCTIGTDAFCATGTAKISTSLAIGGAAIGTSVLAIANNATIGFRNNAGGSTIGAIKLDTGDSLSLGAGTTSVVFPVTVFGTTISLSGVLGLSASSDQLVFQSGGVTGTISWAPATSNKKITLPNGTTDFTATGGTSNVLKQVSAGAAITVAQLACADLSNAAATCSSAAASGLTGQVALANGGTAANLTASNGGIFYSTASAGAILSGTATARQMLQSGASTTPAWSTTTWPATTTVNRILWSSAANVISDLATANSSILVTSSGGIPSLSTTLPAYTLGGTVSGGGNQINNVIIGTTTPLAGSFTTVSGSTSVTSPLLIGGSGTTGTVLTLKSTTGVGASDAIKVLVGSDGAQTAMTILNQGSPNVTTIIGGSVSLSGRSLVVSSQQNGGQPSFAFYHNAAAATKKVMTFIYDGAVSLTDPGMLFQNLDDSGTFVSNSTVFWRDGGISTNSTTYPGEAGSILNAGQMYMPNITTTSAAQTGTVCWTTGTGKFTVDTTTTCLLSLGAAKNIISHLSPSEALEIVSHLDPVAFRYKSGFADNGRYEQFGLIAEKVALVDERLAGRDPEGTLQGVRYQELTAVLAGAIKQLKADNDNLRSEMEQLKRVAR